MPAWGGADEDSDSDSWKLVHFIRHLPALTTAEIVEMEALNPKTLSELQEEMEDQRFLSGSTAEAPNTGDDHGSPAARQPKHH